MSDSARCIDATNESLDELRERGDIGAMRVVKTVAARAVLGSKQYGRFEPKKDRRNFLMELRDELVDALVYIEGELSKMEERRDTDPAPPPAAEAFAAAVSHLGGQVWDPKNDDCDDTAADERGR